MNAVRTTELEISQKHLSDSERIGNAVLEILKRLPVYEANPDTFVHTLEDIAVFVSERQGTSDGDHYRLIHTETYTDFPPGYELKTYEPCHGGEWTPFGKLKPTPKNQ